DRLRGPYASDWLVGKSETRWADRHQSSDSSQVQHVRATTIAIGYRDRAVARSGSSGEKYCTDGATRSTAEVRAAVIALRVVTAGRDVRDADLRAAGVSQCDRKRCASHEHRLRAEIQQRRREREVGANG